MNYVTINGTECPVKYGLSGTTAALALVNGKGIADSQKLATMGLDKWAKFVKAGTDNGAKVEESEPPKLEDIQKELDKDLNLYYDCLDCFFTDNEPKNERFKKAAEEAKQQTDEEGN